MRLFHNEDEIIANDRLRRLSIYLHTGAKFFNDVETKELAKKYEQRHNHELQKYNKYIECEAMLNGELLIVKGEFEFNTHLKTVFTLVKGKREWTKVDLQKLIEVKTKELHNIY